MRKIIKLLRKKQFKDKKKEFLINGVVCEREPKEPLSSRRLFDEKLPISNIDELTGDRSRVTKA